jgi:hypothetical protein
MKYMDAPLVVETQNGTTFVEVPDKKTRVLRSDQPVCELPTADLLEYARNKETSNA